MQPVFGTGSLVLVPSGANPTPVQVGVLQEVTLNVEKSNKELYGAYQSPVAVGEGPMKIDGTAKSGTISAALIRSVMSGAAITTGASVRAAANEVGVVPGTPYQITVAQSATWSVDGGVFDVTAGKFMTRVASSPTAGQYSVAAGVYTFAAADTAHSMWITYYYTAASGNTVVSQNQLMGGGTEFQLRLFNFSQGKFFGVWLHAVRLSKLSLPTKNDDFMVQDLGFTSYADVNGNVLTAYTEE